MNRFANLKPVTEFLDIKRMSRPSNFGEVQSRINYNLSYFSSNYAAVFASKDRPKTTPNARNNPY